MAASRWHAFRFKLPQLEVADSTGEALLDSEDIRPLRLQDRMWNFWTYTIFWFAASGTVATWYAASTPQSAGLSLWESLLCGFGGQALVAIVIVFNGRAGAVYHVGYPILCRASFGVYGAWWPVFNRAVMAIVWNGVNCVQGAQCIYVILHAIFPSISDIPDIMGPGSALDSAGMICLFLFAIITGAFLHIRVPKMRSLVYIKLAVFTTAAVAMMAWILCLSNGLGAVFNQPSKVKGSEKSWLLTKFILLNAAGGATFASNAADFQRYARKPSNVIFGNLVGYPSAAFFIPLIGNIVCAASQNVFGELVWNPLTLLDLLQSGDRYTAGNRAGCFFVGLGFLYSAVFAAIFENSLPAGNDMAALLPRYLTIRRSFYVCAVLSIAICPWYLLGSAAIFIDFLASYQVFLSSITGVLLAQYYIIARGELIINDLYTGDKSAVYHYYHGWNYRAYVAYIVGIIPNFYGFLNNMGVVSNTPLGIVREYYFAYPIGIVLSFFTYWALCANDRPVLMNKLSKWQEPREYLRDDEVIDSPGDGLDGVDSPMQDDHPNSVEGVTSLTKS